MKYSSKMTTRYIDIDSSYRNRLQYPNVGDFEISMNTKGGNVDAFNAEDPVSLSFPYDTGLLGAATTTVTFFGITFIQFTLGASSRNQIDFYIGNYINFPYFAGGVPATNFYLQILYYDTTTKRILCLANPDPYGGGPYPTLNEPYFIRYNLPNPLSANVYSGLTNASASSLQINLGPSASSVNNIYKGKFLFIPPYGAGATTILPYLTNDTRYAYQFSVIDSYNGTTKIATLKNSLMTVPPAGTQYEILDFNYDNFRSLKYVGTEVFNNARCYDIVLTNIQVPTFLPLSNTNGGYITDYPYVWVALYSQTSNSYQQTVISSAPASRKALFKCAALATQPTKYFNLSPMIGEQTVPFRINDDLHFQILLPNGEPLSFSPAYYTFFSGSFTYFPGLGFPTPADPQTNVQASFALTLK
jgi:hypothetical protein